MVGAIRSVRLGMGGRGTMRSARAVAVAARRSRVPTSARRNCHSRAASRTGWSPAKRAYTSRAPAAATPPAMVAGITAVRISSAMRAQLRGLLSLIADERRFYAAGSVFVIIGIAAGLSYPLFVQRLIDEGIMAARMDRINTIGIVLVLLLVAEGIATVLRDYFFNMAGERVTARLRRRVFDHLLLQEIAFFDREKTGELTTRLWSDIPVLARVTGEPFADALRFALFGLCGLALLFYTSPMLTAVVALVVPPIVLSSHYFGVRIKASSAEVQERYARSGAVAEQSLHGIRTVRAFSQEAAESRRFGDFIDAALR